MICPRTCYIPQGPQILQIGLDLCEKESGKTLELTSVKNQALDQISALDQIQNSIPRSIRIERNRGVNFPPFTCEFKRYG